MNKPAVLIAQPLYAHVAPLAMMSFTSFLLRCATTGTACNIFQSVNMYVDSARNDAVKIALREGENIPLGKGTENLGEISHVLFCDSDMVLPTDGLDKLLARELESVGGLYFGKVPPFNPVAFSLDPFKRLDDYEEDSLMRVDGLGMGFTLVATDVFRRMRDHFKDENWFRAGEGIGEDVWFYMRLKQMGIPTYLDSTVKCGHVGELVVAEDSFRQVRKNTADKANGRDHNPPETYVEGAPV